MLQLRRIFSPTLTHLQRKAHKRKAHKPTGRDLAQPWSLRYPPPCSRLILATPAAGHLPEDADGEITVGKVGEEITSDEAQAAAQLCALNVLGTLKSELGDLDKVKKLVKVVGFVNCVDSFANQPFVLNGASNLFAEVFGEKGVHSRSAVGTNALPLNVPVEVECIFEVEDGA